MPDAPADTAPDAAAAAPPRRSPLHAVHEAAGASFTDFAGWLMPVRYTSDLAEHRAVREAAGIFDISHMAEIAVEGEGAAAFLDSVLAGKLSAIAEWQAKYTLLLDPSGGIVDDLIVYRTGEESFLVVANAGNHDPVLAVLAEAAAGRDDVEVDDASDDVALIAVQGPVSRAILEATAGLETETPLEALRYYRATAARFAGQDVLVARTGYTGEDGYELYVATEDAVALWEALVAAGTPLGLLNTGLACRDTLRLEAGIRSTATSWASTRSPSRPASARSSRSARRATSAGAPRSRRARIPSPACSSASSPRAAARPAPTTPSTPRRPRATPPRPSRPRWRPPRAPSRPSASSRAAPCRPRSATPSPWRTWIPRSPPPARASPSTSAAHACPPPS